MSCVSQSCHGSAVYHRCSMCGSHIFRGSFAHIFRAKIYINIFVLATYFFAVSTYNQEIVAI